MHWLRMFHWCLVRLEREAGGGSKRPPGPSELDAAVFQITLEVWWWLAFAVALVKKWAFCPVGVSILKVEREQGFEIEAMMSDSSQQPTRLIAAGLCTRCNLRSIGAPVYADVAPKIPPRGD